MKSASVLFGAFVVAASSAGVLVTSCSSGDSGAATVDGGPDGGPFAELALSMPCVGSVDAVYGDPGPLAPDPATRGDIVTCATDPDLTKEALQAKITEIGYVGKPLTSGAHVYRVAYRTERGDAASTAAVSSAIVYVPDAPRAEKLPIVIVGRGSRGQGATCAVSRFDPSQADINADADAMIYPLVGQGYAVIVSDLAGYANFGAPNNPLSAYAQAADVARSMLDSGRALKKLFPSLDDKVVVVGHSQGGHGALASLALAEAYGSAAPIVGVAVYAPLWLSQRSWGAVLVRSIGKDYPVDTSVAPPVSVWYHYTQAELLDGPGEGKKLFAAANADALEHFVKTTCWDQKAEVLKPFGTYADEYFDPAFVSSVGKPATGLLGPCPSNDAVCTKWLARYSADRPHLTGAAKTTPILVAYGGKDDTIPPGRMRCALDRLHDDGANVTICVDPEQGHSSVVSAKSDYVGDWIASVALGAPAPQACAVGESGVEASECDTPPPND